MLELAEKIGSVLWTPVMLVVLMGSSIILTIKFKFFQVTQIKKISRETVGTLFAGARIARPQKKLRDKNKIS